MAMQVTGPRAGVFVDTLSDFCGETLVLNAATVAVDPNTLLDPFESETLRDLVDEIIASPNLVEIHAFGGRPSTAFFVDSFFSNPGVQRPRRSVYMNDILEIAQKSTTLARAAMGHILREYYGASRPPGQAPGNAFAVYHVA